MTLMPAIAGIRRSSWCWSPLRIAPPPPRNSSGRRKLKKAALGFRQNMRRSSRYWRQPRVTLSGIGGELQVDILERRPPDGQLSEALAAGQGLVRQLVQQPGGIVGLPFDEPAV